MEPSIPYSPDSDQPLRIKRFKQLKQGLPSPQAPENPDPPLSQTSGPTNLPVYSTPPEILSSSSTPSTQRPPEFTATPLSNPSLPYVRKRVFDEEMKLIRSQSVFPLAEEINRFNVKSKFQTSYIELGIKLAYTNLLVYVELYLATGIALEFISISRGISSIPTTKQSLRKCTNSDF